MDKKKKLDYDLFFFSRTFRRLLDSRKRILIPFIMISMETNFSDGINFTTIFPL